MVKGLLDEHFHMIIIEAVKYNFALAAIPHNTVRILPRISQS